MKTEQGEIKIGFTGHGMITVSIENSVTIRTVQLEIEMAEQLSRLLTEAITRAKTYL